MDEKWKLDLGDVVDHEDSELRGYGLETGGHLVGSERARVWAPVFWRAAKHEASSLLCLAASVKSPMEEMFAVALYGAAHDDDSTVLLRSDKSYVSLLRYGRTLPHDSGHTLSISTQVPVGKYFCDFIIEREQQTLKAKVAVEIDGHDFHEKTKAQAAHDKKRDRFFTRQGLKLLRFTGSEVFKDAPACAEEVLKFLEDDICDQIDALAEAWHKEQAAKAAKP